MLEVLWGFGLSVAWVSGVPSAPEIGRWTLVLVAPALFPPRRFEWILWLLVGWAAVSLAWTPWFGVGLGELLELGALVMLASASPRLEGVLKGLAWGLALQLPLMVGQLEGWPLGLEQAAPPAGLFGNRDLLGELVGVVLIWLVWRRRWWLVAPLGAMLVLTGSRVGLLALVAGLACQRRYWIGLVLLGLAFFLCLEPEKLGSLGRRLEDWQEALSLVSWQGLGLGFWRAASPRAEVVHSSLLTVVSELGLGAGLLLAWLTTRRLFDDGLVAALSVALLVESIVSFPLGEPALAALGAVVASQLGRRGYPFWAELVSRRGRIKAWPRSAYSPGASLAWSASDAAGVDGARDKEKLG